MRDEFIFYIEIGVIRTLRFIKIEITKFFNIFVVCKIEDLGKKLLKIQERFDFFRQGFVYGLEAKET